jgi:hypothetical protein
MVAGRRFVYLALAALLLSLTVTGAAAQANRQQTAQTQMAEWQLSTVADWEAGQIEDLLITNNVDGELRLAEGETSGSFISAPFETEFPFNAAGLVWMAEVPEDTLLRLDLRERTVPLESTNPLLNDDDWGPWQELTAADARSQVDQAAFASPDVLVFQRGSRYVQLRLRMSSEVERTSPVVSAVSVFYLDSSRGVPTSPGLQRGPIIFGPDTLTPRPTLVLRSTWNGRGDAASPRYGMPRGIVLHQIDTLPGFEATTELLRALTTYQREALGWDDLAYHYVIDDRGNLYEGRLGGPTSQVPRMSGGDVAIHVAYVGSLADEISAEARGTLTGLLAWLGQAYDIPPEGEHLVDVQGEAVERANIVGHNAFAPDAFDPGPSLAELLPELRDRASRSTVRARWYFPEGNLQEYSMRLSFFNPTETATDATTFLIDTVSQPARSASRVLQVPAESRSDLLLSALVNQGVLTGTPGLSTVVDSSAPLLAERSMGLVSDLDIGPGLSELSTIWYFAEGSTSDRAQTYLVLFNPQSSATAVTMRYIREDGRVSQDALTIPAQQRRVIAVSDSLPGARFGVQVIATQPIAAERTMRFGPNPGGLHVGNGINELGRRWYFAEGTTQNPFTMRLLILNPNDQVANTTVRFLRADGEAIIRRYAIPATTRLDIDVNNVIDEEGIAMVVDADRPVAAERALYLRDSEAGTVTAGAREPHFDWYFVDGRSSNTSYFLLFSNPGERDARVRVDFVFGGDGARATEEVLVPAGARYTMAVSELYPGESSIAAVVRSTQQIVAERSLYPSGGDGGGTTTLGIPGER